MKCRVLDCIYPVLPWYCLVKLGYTVQGMENTVSDAGGRSWGPDF